MNGLIKFNGISQTEAAQVLAGYSADYIEAAFKAWTDDFEHRVLLSYSAQVRRYEEYVTHQYIKQKSNVPDTESMEDWQIEAYHEYLEGTDLPLMRCEQERWMYHLKQSNSKDWAWKQPLSYMTILIEELTSDKPSPRTIDVQYMLWSYWFDTTINNDTSEFKRLRAMPYKDYLLTSHWRRVKEAIMIAYQARCQGEKCIYFDEGFWLDTRLLHVHHVSYKNRGNERFHDLMLLCNDCHQELHALIS